MTDRMLQIGDVAERCGLSLRTVRYYEEMGLLSPEKRTEGGFRLYTEEHVERLAVIKQLKPLGFTVQQMREVLDVRDALRSEHLGEEERRLAQARLKEFAAAAERRCAVLREQLASSEGMAKQLRWESRRPLTPAKT